MIEKSPTKQNPPPKTPPIQTKNPQTQQTNKAPWEFPLKYVTQGKYVHKEIK